MSWCLCIAQNPKFNIVFLILKCVREILHFLQIKKSTLLSLRCEHSCVLMSWNSLSIGSLSAYPTKLKIISKWFLWNLSHEVSFILLLYKSWSVKVTQPSLLMLMKHKKCCEIACEKLLIFLWVQWIIFLSIGKSREPERSPTSMENSREEVGIKTLLTSLEWLMCRKYCH